MRNRSNRMPEQPQQPQFEQPQPLENMFPETYHVVYPEVVRQINMMENMYGPVEMPTKSQLESNVEQIFENVKNIVKERSISSRDYEALQRGGFFRDIIWILFLQELIGRRRRRHPFFRPFPFRPPFYPF
ncbi:MAG: hypothetical protein GX285_03470 [Clostridiales bacterium]|nr:hypothetical protein [Clostridiales bacterium]